MRSDKNIECEVRGCITVSDFNEIRNRIEKEWGRLNESPELVIFFEDKHDLRLKIDKSGIILVSKKTINRKSGARNEIELKFDFSKINTIINFISQLEFRKGLFSYCRNFKIQKDNFSLSFKFNTRLGDFFEIKERIDNKSDINKTYKRLINLTEQYGLQVWDRETYKKIIKKSWSNIKKEHLVISGDLHPLIKKIVTEISHIKDAKMNTSKTIGMVLKSKSNDYSDLEKKFKNSTGIDLLSWKHSPIKNWGDKVSIVIPSYNSWPTLNLTLSSIENQNLHKDQKKLIEVIVIDDGSIDNTENKIKRKKYFFKLKYFKQNNLGRVYARNLGVSMASGDVLIFIDSDMILERNFINEHLIRHHYLDNIVLVSFKENILSKHTIVKNFLKKFEYVKPDIKKDFRFEKTVKKSWLRMHRHVRNIEMRTVKLIEETDNFKTFGNDRILGVWDLPSMVITSALSLKKKDFDFMGGLNLQFKGWGMEDTFLGSCLITQGNYIIPCFSTGAYHIKHAPRSGSNKKRISEFNRNILVYLDLINRPINKIFKKLTELK